MVKRFREIVEAALLLLAVGLAEPRLVAQALPLPLTGELRANQFTTDAQENPKVGMAADGDYVVAWSSLGQDGDSGSIVIRRFPGTGGVPFDELVVNQANAGDQFRPGIDMNASGDFVVVWDTDVDGAGLRGRRSTNGGTTLGSEFRLTASTSTESLRPNVARADDGSFVATFQSDGSSARHRRFGTDGAADSGDRDAAPAFATAVNPAIATAPGGATVIVFETPDAGGFGIVAQRYDSAGNPVGDPIEVPETEANNQGVADVAMADDGSFVVSWKDTPLGLRARRFNATGKPLGREIAVSPQEPFGRPSVAVAPLGAFVLAFASGGVINAREYDRTGKPVGDAFVVSVTNELVESADAATNGHRFVVVWDADDLDNSNLAVAHRLYLMRSIFADDLESRGTSAWSLTTGD